MPHTQYTQEELEAAQIKQAAENVASRGFLTFIKAAGANDNQAAILHKEYVDQRNLRSAKYAAGVSAILGN